MPRYDVRYSRTIIYETWVEAGDVASAAAFARYLADNDGFNLDESEQIAEPVTTVLAVGKKPEGANSL